MLCCGCFVSSSSLLVHCAENESIREWRTHFDQRQKAGACIIPGRIFWLFHPWLIHQTSVTNKNIVFNHSHNPRSVPRWDLSPNRQVYCRLLKSSWSRNLWMGSLALWFLSPSSSFKLRSKFKPVDWMMPSACWVLWYLQTDAARWTTSSPRPTPFITTGVWHQNWSGAFPFKTSWPICRLFALLPVIMWSNWFWKLAETSGRVCVRHLLDQVFIAAAAAMKVYVFCVKHVIHQHQGNFGSQSVI